RSAFRLLDKGLSFAFFRHAFSVRRFDPFSSTHRYDRAEVSMKRMGLLSLILVAGPESSAFVAAPLAAPQAPPAAPTGPAAQGRGPAPVRSPGGGTDRRVTLPLC